MMLITVRLSLDSGCFQEAIKMRLKISFAQMQTAVTVNAGIEVTFDVWCEKERKELNHQSVIT